MAQSLLLATNEVIGARYRVLKEIGRGGFSVVYMAEDRSIGGNVAIKLVIPPPADAKIAFQRLQREALALRELHHPNIVQGIDLIIEEQRALFVMQYIDGCDLASQVKKHGPLNASEVIQLGNAMALALSAAHSAGIVHRDVKPQNILLEKSGHFWLSDFGSAQVIGQSSLTVTGGIMGTLGYIAPELLSTRRADSRADIYSLGITLYFAVTGRMPGNEGAIAVLPKEEGYDPRQVQADIPAGLAAAIKVATCADPTDRFPTAESFGRILTTNALVPIADSSVPPAIICLACGEEGNVEFGICGRCLALSPADASAFVYLDKSKGREALLTDQLKLLFPYGIKKAIAHETIDGIRPLLRTSPVLAKSVVQHLKRVGVSAHILPVDSLLKLVPLDILVLTGVIAALTIKAWLTIGSSFLLPGVMICCSLLYFGRKITSTSLVEAAPRVSQLSTPLEKRVANVMLSIENGSLRKLLSRLTSSIADILNSEDGPSGSVASRQETEQLLWDACEISESIWKFDKLARSVEGLSEQVEYVEKFAKIERWRDEAMHRLLRIVAIVGELNMLRIDVLAESSLPLSAFLDELQESTRLYSQAYKELAL